MSVRIVFDSHKLTNWLSAIEQRQLPYASSLALTRTGYDCRDAIRANLRKKLILRNTWTEKGIISTRADKAQFPKLSIEVGSRDWYMKDQELGGERKPKKSRYLAIPVSIRSDKTVRITPAKRPRALLNKPNYFVGPLKNKPGYKGIFLKKRKGVRLQYLLSPRPTKLAKRDSIQKTVSNLGPKRMQQQFQRAMAQAIQTARQ